MAGYLGNIPSAVPLTSADIADGIITSAKIVDGTIVNADINASAGIDSTKISGLSSDFVLLASTEASSSASVSFDGYFSSTYKTYQVIVNNMIGATNNQEHYIRLRTSNADITSGYKFIVHTGMRSSGAESTLLNSAWNSTVIRTVQNSTSNTASRGGINMLFYIANPLNTSSQKMIYGESCAYNEDESEWYSSNFSANNSTTSALSGITFYMQSGNIASGNFKLYGIK
jgi:hypothetical protein